MYEYVYVHRLWVCAHRLIWSRTVNPLCKLTTHCNGCLAVFASCVPRVVIINYMLPTWVEQWETYCGLPEYESMCLTWMCAEVVWVWAYMEEKKAAPLSRPNAQVKQLEGFLFLSNCFWIVGDKSMSISMGFQLY